MLARSYDSQRIRIDEQRRQRQTLDQASPHLLAPFRFGPGHDDVRIQALEDGTYVFGRHRAGEQQDRKHFEQHDQIV